VGVVGDPDGHGHALCEQIGLVERVAGVIQGIVVIKDHFREIGAANVFEVSFFLRCSKNQYECRLSVLKMGRKNIDLPISDFPSHSSTISPTESSISCRRDASSAWKSLTEPESRRRLVLNSS
jgi:hypothetical protein